MKLYPLQEIFVCFYTTTSEFSFNRELVGKMMEDETGRVHYFEENGNEVESRELFDKRIEQSVKDRAKISARPPRTHVDVISPARMAFRFDPEVADKFAASLRKQLDDKPMYPDRVFGDLGSTFRSYSNGQSEMIKRLIDYIAQRGLYGVEESYVFEYSGIDGITKYAGYDDELTAIKEWVKSMPTTLEYKIEWLRNHPYKGLVSA